MILACPGPTDIGADHSTVSETMDEAVPGCPADTAVRNGCGRPLHSRDAANVIELKRPVWALLVVRGGGKGKRRLATVLHRAARSALIEAMAEDVLRELSQARGIDGIAIATADTALADLAKCFGAIPIMDDGQAGLNAVIDRCARHLEGKGVATLLVLPGDVPFVSSRDIEALLREHEGGVTVAIAASDGGTNALLVTPPSAIEFQFGLESGAAHLRAAQHAGLPGTALDIPGFRCDIDRPEDLLRLLDPAVEGCAADLIRAVGLSHQTTLPQGIEAQRVSAR